MNNVETGKMSSVAMSKLRFGAATTGKMSTAKGSTTRDGDGHLAGFYVTQSSGPAQNAELEKREKRADESELFSINTQQIVMKIILLAYK